MKEKLVYEHAQKIKQMRAMMNAAPNGRLTDEAFAEYRQLENDADSLAGRIANATGQPWGARLDDSMSRVERLEARERYGRTSQWCPGLEGGPSRTSGGGQFETLGQQLQAIVRAGTHGQETDHRLFEVRAASGLNEAVGAEGGFLVQAAFATDLLEAGMEAANLAPRCLPFPIPQNSNSIDLPTVDETSRANGSRFGGVRLYWAGEGADLTGSKPKFRKVSLKPWKLTGLVYLTDELVEDVAVLDAFIRMVFPAEFAFVIDDAIIRGNGAGQPLGVLNAGVLVSVDKETGQAPKTVITENIVKMYSRMPASSLGRAAWFINQDVLPQLMAMSVLVKNAAGTQVYGGAPIFIPAGSIAGRPYNTLLGLPVIPIEQCETLGTAGDIILGDFGRYLLSTRGNMRVDTSIHVRFVQDEMVMRFAFRVDGQPKDAAPLTPYKGTDPVSPFVTLAERA